jgi:hypothetical protein
VIVHGLAGGVIVPALAGTSSGQTRQTYPATRDTGHFFRPNAADVPLGIDHLVSPCPHPEGLTDVLLCITGDTLVQ